MKVNRSLSSKIWFAIRIIEGGKVTTHLLDEKENTKEKYHAKRRKLTRHHIDEPQAIQPYVIPIISPCDDIVDEPVCMNWDLEGPDLTDYTCDLFDQSSPPDNIFDLSETFHDSLGIAYS